MRTGLKILIKLPLVAVAAALMGWVVMWLWNWVVPPLFDGARTIDFLHAVGLIVLCRILFGGFHGRGGWHHRHDRGHWRGWRNLSRDERQRFDKEEV